MAGEFLTDSSGNIIGIKSENSGSSGVTMTDNSEDVMNAFEESVERALTRIGLSAERYAKEGCPVDTGLLRNSITFALDGQSANISSYKASKRKPGEKKVRTGSYSGSVQKENGATVYVGSNVEYAQFIELKKAFLKPAVTGHAETFKRIVEDEMKNA